MPKIANIAKNTSYFTIALIMQKIISFTYFTILARNFAPDDLGKYYFAVSFTTIFSVFIDLGLANVLTREVAKYGNAECGMRNAEFAAGGKIRNFSAQKLLGAALAIKLPLAILTVIAAAIMINVLNYPAITRQLVYFSIVCMLLDSFTLIFYSVIRAFHNLKYESIGSVGFQVIALVLGALFIKLNFSLTVIMLALVAASLFNFLFSASLVKFRWKLSLKPIYDSALIKYLAGIAVIFGIFGILQRLWTYFDSVLLSILAGDYYVGIYQVAFKIINALQFLPLAFAASLYPAFASYWKNNREQLPVTFERAMSYLLIISLPIAIGIIALADKIVMIFKSGYLPAVLPLQISIASLTFLFLTFPIGSLLNACDRQKRNTLNLLITFLASIALNIILIPKYKAVGASITVLATNMLILILGLFQVPKIMRYDYNKIIITLMKVLSSAVFMGFCAVLLKNYLNIFFVVALSGMAYFAVLFIIGGFRKEDILSIIKSLKS